MTGVQQMRVKTPPNGSADVVPNRADRALITHLTVNGSQDGRSTSYETGTGSLVGYARVSTSDQELALQLDALAAAGCPRVFTEHASGTKADRPELARALDYVRPGDVLTVWKLDRLGRSLPHLIETVGALEERGIGFRSLQESIDTTSPAGRLVFHIFCALAQFERDLIRERTMAGLEAARARGRRGGRPIVMTPEKIAAARGLYNAGELTVAQIAATLGVSRASVYRSLAADG